MAEESGTKTTKAPQQPTGGQALSSSTATAERQAGDDQPNTADEAVDDQVLGSEWWKETHGEDPRESGANY